MKAPQKILFFRLDARVGDCIVHLFFLRELKKLFPNTHITVATFAPSEVFFQNNPFVDEVKVLPKLAANDSYLRPAVLWGLLKMLVHSRTAGYDYIIVNPVRATWRNKLYCHLLPRTLWPQFDYTKHITHSYAQFLRQLGAKEVDTSYALDLPVDAKNYAQQFLHENNLQPGQFWIVNPVGSSPARNCSAQQIQTLIKTISQAGHKVVLLDYQNQFASLHLPCPRYTAHAIFQTAALIEQASAVVTVDTGIVHLVDCFHKKMFVLYAADHYSLNHNRVFWASRQDTTRFLQGTNTVQDIPVTQIEQMLKREFL
ncbi:MAG: glycosyltransferase family 9 protein [Elusimicrobiaceae bacterium]|nr:glycosyltransferase family 9 protein [Elusimicrobiaceae bacterium]